MTTKYTLCI